MNQFGDLCLKEWHYPTIAKCCKCDKMARITIFLVAGGNNYCADHAKDEVIKYLQEVETRGLEDRNV